MRLFDISQNSFLERSSGLKLWRDNLSGGETLSMVCGNTLRSFCVAGANLFGGSVGRFSAETLSEKPPFVAASACMEDAVTMSNIRPACGLGIITQPNVCKLSATS